MTKPYSFQVVGGISVLRFSRSPTLNEILGAMEVLSEGGAARRRLWVLEGGASLDRAELAAIAQRAINIWPVPSRSVRGSRCACFDGNRRPSNG